MAHPDRLRTGIRIALIAALAVGLLGCRPINAAQPMQPISTDPPPALFVDTPSPTPIIWTPTLAPTPEILITPTLFELPHGQPPEWPVGVDNLAINQERIKNTIEAQPDQVRIANENMPSDFLKSVVQLKSHYINNEGEQKAYGGTGTVIASDANFSYILTATHVVSTVTPTDFSIYNPFVDTRQEIDLTQMLIVNSNEYGKPDIAIIRVPRISTLGEFNQFEATYCDAAQPTAGENVSYFGFPYVNSSYTPFFSSGSIENIGAPCWIEDASQTVFLSTTVPAVVGSSGGLVLNSRGQGIGVIGSVGPNGAQVVPLGETTISALLAAAGYVGP